MPQTLPQIDIRTRAAWRAWLARHHASSPGVWLVIHKKHTGVPSVAYDDAVREALCFGWIDSLAKRLDEDRYVQKYTPRKPGSFWSDNNRKRWAELKSEKLLAAAGLAAAPTDKRYAPRPVVPDMPAYLRVGAQSEPEGAGVLSHTAPNPAAKFRRMGPPGQAAGDARATAARVDQTPEGRKKAGAEVAPAL